MWTAQALFQLHCKTQCKREKIPCITHGERRQKTILGDKGLTFQSDGSVVCVRSQPCHLQPTLQSSKAIHADLPMTVLCLHAWHSLTIPEFPPALTRHILHHAKKRVTHRFGLGGNADNCFWDANPQHFSIFLAHGGTARSCSPTHQTRTAMPGHCSCALTGIYKAFDIYVLI